MSLTDFNVRRSMNSKEDSHISFGKSCSGSMFDGWSASKELRKRKEDKMELMWIGTAFDFSRSGDSRGSRDTRAVHRLNSDHCYSIQRETTGFLSKVNGTSDWLT